MNRGTHTNPWTPAAKITAATILILWAGLAYGIGIAGLATAPATEILRPIGLTALVPVATFVVAYLISGRFRRFVLAQDLLALTRLQHWRVVGFAFLLLYAHDVLPGLFAWFAGVGDVLVGLAAPAVVARLARESAFARSWRFLTYHALGLLDFAVAIAAATLASGAFPQLLSGPVTSAPMEVWPLNLFPSFIVPLFIMLHLGVFLKVRALRHAESAPLPGAFRSTRV